MSNLEEALTIRLWELDEKQPVVKKKFSGVSKRNWEEEAKRFKEVHALPLLSRSDMSNTKEKSLRDVEMQYELWNYIMNMMFNLEKPNDRKSWVPLVSHFRKLREGVYASNWSNGNHEFTIQVYEWSINASLKAQDFDELFKSLKGLVDELYVLKRDLEKPFFTVLYILYFCCFIKNKDIAMKQLERLDPSTKEAQFAKQLIHCIFVTKNPIVYFKLYQQAPYMPYKWIMENYHETVRIIAIKMLQRAYLSVSLDWAKIWLGLENEAEVVPMMNALVPCVDRFDADTKTVHFIKSNKKVQVQSIR